MTQRGTPMRVLHVESDVRNAADVRRALGRHEADWIPTCAMTRAEALARLDSDAPYDVLLVNLRLADGDGVELVDELRRRGVPSAIVVGVGIGDDDAAMVALKAGADDYVVMRDDYPSRLVDVLRAAHRRFLARRAQHSRRLRVLYAEDEPDDAELASLHLARHAPHVELAVVESASATLQALEHAGTDTPFDVLLLDYGLPGMNALELLKHLRERRRLDIPVVVVTGQGDEDVALQALKLGAVDYLVKTPGYLYRLAPSLENACFGRELQRKETAARASEERLRAVVGVLPDAVYVVDGLGCVQLWTEGARQLYGYADAEMIGTSSSRLYDPDASPSESLREDLEAARGRSRDVERWRVRKDGRKFLASVVVTSIAGPHVGPLGQFVVVDRNLTRQQRRERVLGSVLRRAREGRESLRRVWRRLLEAQESERGHVANELREHIAQSLVAAKLGLDAAAGSSDPRVRVDEAAACRVALEDAVSRLWSLAHELRPALLDDLGLEAALRWLLERDGTTSGLRTNLTIVGIGERLPACVEHAAYRIARSAIENVALHAKARRLDVELHIGATAVHLHVRDDGVGFEVGSVRGKLRNGPRGGIPAMREQAMALGGRVTVRSSAGGGTQVAVTLPLSVG